MTNNDFFNYLLHLTGVGKSKDLMIEIFKLGGIEASPSKIKGWRTALDNPRSSEMTNKVLMGFIQGFFEYRDMKISKGINIFNFDHNAKKINNMFGEN